MVAGLLITAIYCTAVWLVFFRFKLIRFTPGGVSSLDCSALTFC